MGHALFCIARKLFSIVWGTAKGFKPGAVFSFCPVFLPRIETNRRNSL